MPEARHANSFAAITGGSESVFARFQAAIVAPWWLHWRPFTRHYIVILWSILLWNFGIRMKFQILNCLKWNKTIAMVFWFNGSWTPFVNVIENAIVNVNAYFNVYSCNVKSKGLYELIGFVPLLCKYIWRSKIHFHQEIKSDHADMRRLRSHVSS